MQRKSWVWAGLLIMILGLAACGGSDQSTPAAGPGLERSQPPAEYAGKVNPLAGQADAAERGGQSYQVFCVSCHGEHGQGDGPISASLNPKPSNLAEAQAGLSDDYLYWRIAEGGLGAPFNSTMPGWKGSLGEEQIWEMVTFLRTFGK
ncbi:MAG: c-type cytochrome [Chloroflexota bacterium]